MQRYTARQVQRALAQERLLQRLDQGEAFESACRELGLSLSRNYVSQLRRRYRQGGSSWEALVDQRRGHPHKLTAKGRVWLRERKHQDPTLTQQELASLYEAEFQQTISQAHVSNILRDEGLAIPGGQHYPLREERALPLERVGVFFPPHGGAANGPTAERRSGHYEAGSRLPRA